MLPAKNEIVRITRNGKIFRLKNSAVKAIIAKINSIAIILNLYTDASTPNVKSTAIPTNGLFCIISPQQTNKGVKNSVFTPVS